MQEQFLVFDWHGFMAHFRKLDTNSSSLSYSFPPPTVISGMLAGICGMERDQYYSIFSSDHIQFGIQIRKTPRKIIQTVNYIFAKSKNDLNMSGENPHTQIPMELVVCDSFPNDHLSYRIFLKITDKALFEVLYSHFSELGFRYVPYLGSASFQSWLEWIKVKYPAIVHEEKTTVNTVLPTDVLKDHSFLWEQEGISPAVYLERVRRSFLENREPGKLIDVLWEKNYGQIKSQFSEPVYRFTFENEDTHVIFI